MPSMMKAPHSKGANCPMCDGGACKMAEGGEVKGVHTSMFGDGMSEAGAATRNAQYEKGRIKKRDIGHAKEKHETVLGQITAMKGKDRTNLAEGGDVEQDDGDEELSHGLGKELMGALESKDHKKLMSSLEACVLHCMSKGESDGDK